MRDAGLDESMTWRDISGGFHTPMHLCGAHECMEHVILLCVRVSNQGWIQYFHWGELEVMGAPFLLLKGRHIY